MKKFLTSLSKILLLPVLLLAIALLYISEFFKNLVKQIKKLKH
jgi:hypothetical protein